MMEKTRQGNSREQQATQQPPPPFPPNMSGQMQPEMFPLGFQQSLYSGSFPPLFPWFVNTPPLVSQRQDMTDMNLLHFLPQPLCGFPLVQQAGLPTFPMPGQAATTSQEPDGGA